MELENIRERMKILFLSICEKYPDDTDLKSSLELFYGSCYLTDTNDIDVILEIDDEIRQEKTYEELMKEIEDKIKNSFVERDIHEDNLPTGNLKQCLQSLKINYSVTKTYEKKLLYSYAQCGEILNKFKTFLVIDEADQFTELGLS